MMMMVRILTHDGHYRRRYCVRTIRARLSERLLLASETYPLFGYEVRKI